MNDPHPTTDESPHDSHIRSFLWVFGGLCLLTLTSFGIANSGLRAWPSVAWSLMIGVSCAKALLVISYFMHLKWETSWKFVLTIPATVMSVLLCLTLFPDMLHRFERYNENRLRHAAEPHTASYELEAPVQTTPHE